MPECPVETGASSAAYISLMTSAKACGETSALSLLEQNLEEERRMAEWIAKNLPQVTATYLSLRASGESAGSDPRAPATRSSEPLPPAPVESSRGEEYPA